MLLLLFLPLAPSPPLLLLLSSDWLRAAGCSGVSCSSPSDDEDEGDDVTGGAQVEERGGADEPEGHNKPVTLFPVIYEATLLFQKYFFWNDFTF